MRWHSSRIVVTCEASAVGESGGSMRAVVLVEGESDRNALEALAERRGRDLAAEGVAVEPIGGAQAIGRFLERFGPRGLDVRLAGLYDAGEEPAVRRSLERAGLGSGSHATRDGAPRFLRLRPGSRGRADPVARPPGRRGGRRRPGRAQVVSRRSNASRPSGTSRSRASCAASWARTAVARSATAALLVEALDLAVAAGRLDLVLAPVGGRLTCRRRSFSARCSATSGAPRRPCGSRRTPPARSRCSARPPARSRCAAITTPSWC